MPIKSLCPKLDKDINEYLLTIEYLGILVKYPPLHADYSIPISRLAPAAPPPSVGTTEPVARAQLPGRSDE